MTKQSLIDAGVPEHDHDPLLLWVTEGLQPGHFLTAVLSNDLHEAVARADDDNRKALANIISWLSSYAPHDCWGSAKNVEAWRVYKQRQRAKSAEKESSLPTVYVFCNAKGCRDEGDWHVILGVDEDGKGLASHVCSAHGYARHDMGIDTNGWKRDLYAARYPNGFSVRWIEGAELDAMVAKWNADKPVEDFIEEEKRRHA